MGDWLQAPDEDEDGTGGVVAALADPRGTFGDENGAAPEVTPTIREGSPSEDSNADADREAAEMAGTAATQPPYKPADDSGLPPDESMLSSEFQPANNRAETAAPVESAGDSSDVEAAQLAGDVNLTAPAPLKYTPYEDHSADEQALVAQRAGEDPTKYKPGVGRRILAGLAGFAAGAGSRNAGEGLNVAKQITGRPLEQAKEQWAAQEAPLKQQIEADKAADASVTRQNVQETNRYNADERNMTNQARVANWNAQAQQRRDMAQAKLNTVDKNTLGPVDPKNPFGEWQGKTPGGKTVRGLDPPASVQKDPRFIAQQRRQQLSDMAAGGVKLTPQETKYFLINGKLSEPTEHTSVNIRENPDGSAVAPSGRGGSPTDPDNIIAKNMQDKQAFIGKWRRVGPDEASDATPEGSYVATDGSGKFMDGKEYNSQIEKFRTDLNANANMRKSGVMVDEGGNTVRVGPQTAATGKQPQAKASATMAVANPKGLVEAGNLPIWNRPLVQNADGTHSSEYSISMADDKGREVLVPTVVNGKFLTPDGKKPPEGSPAEKTMFKAAWQHYLKTGENLGKFDNPDNADAYAETLHNREQQQQPAQAPKVLPHPAQAQFNVAKWKAANPSGKDKNGNDFNAVISYAKSKGYAIVGQ